MAEAQKKRYAKAKRAVKAAAKKAAAVVPAAEVSQGCPSRIYQREESGQAHERGHQEEVGCGGEGTLGGEEDVR